MLEIQGNDQDQTSLIHIDMQIFWGDNHTPLA